MQENETPGAGRLPYKLPKIYWGKEEQFVYYSYWCRARSKYVRRKFRCALWKMTDEEKKQRLQEGVEKVTRLLADRNRLWQYQDQFSGRPDELDGQISLTSWIELAIEQELGKERKAAYRKLLFNLNAFIEQNSKLEGVEAPEWAEKWAHDFGAWIKAGSHSTKTKNDLLWAHSKLGEWLKLSLKTLNWPDLKQFRVKKIKNESGKYVPFTHEEKVLVFNYYEKKRPNYKMFLLLVYYTSIRPAELHRLQVKDFDLKGRKISVSWMRAKNGLSKHVQILEPLLEALKNYGLSDLPPDFFLFGDQGMPGPTKIKKVSWSANLWFRDAPKMGLAGTGKTPYSFKHTFNIDYIENNKKNVDWEWLRRHNRHATIQQTQEYISALTAYFLDEGTAKILDYVR